MRERFVLSVGALAVALAVLSGCGPATGIRPPDAGVRWEQNVSMLAKLDELGQDGDWLVTMGYKKTDQLVATATNIPISHAAVLDRSLSQAIEADSSGVHATPLADFVDHNHRVILIRPVWAEVEGAGKQALERARVLCGAKYDFAGTVGLNDPSRFYCSELTVAIYKPFHKPYHRLPPVIEPGQLYLWGTVLYDSRPRDWN